MTKETRTNQIVLDPTQLIAVANNSELLEVGRKAVEDALVGLRDDGIMAIRNNGLVIRDRNGAHSSIIRFGTEDAICLGLKAIAKHLASNGG